MPQNKAIAIENVSHFESNNRKKTQIKTDGNVFHRQIKSHIREMNLTHILLAVGNNQKLFLAHSHSSKITPNKLYN